MLEELFTYENIKINDVSCSKEIYIYGSLVEQKPRCPVCQAVESQQVHKYTRRVFQDISIGEHTVWLKLRVTSYQCKCCGKYYKAKSKDLSKKHNLTARMEEYIGKMVIKESYETISSLTKVSIGNISNIYVDYLREELKKYKKEKASRLMFGKSIIKSKKCIWIATIDSARIVYMEPEASDTKKHLQNFLLDWYKDESPEVIYIGFSMGEYEEMKQIFQKSKIVLNPVELEEKLKKILEETAKRYKLSINTKEKTIELLEPDMTTPRDERMNQLIKWTKKVYSFLKEDNFVTEEEIRKTFMEGKDFLGKIDQYSFFIFEKHPEVIADYSSYSFSEKEKKTYRKILYGISEAKKSKTLQRAIQKLVMTENFVTRYKELEFPTLELNPKIEYEMEIMVGKGKTEKIHIDCEEISSMKKREKRLARYWVYIKDMIDVSSK